MILDIAQHYSLAKQRQSTFQRTLYFLSYHKVYSMQGKLHIEFKEKIKITCFSQNLQQIPSVQYTVLYYSKVYGGIQIL